MQLHCKRKRKSLRQTFELITNYAMIFFWAKILYKFNLCMTDKYLSLVLDCVLKLCNQNQWEFYLQLKNMLILNI